MRALFLYEYIIDKVKRNLPELNHMAGTERRYIHTQKLTKEVKLMFRITEIFF